jgi:hypothetical protein
VVFRHWCLGSSTAEVAKPFNLDSDVRLGVYTRRSRRRPDDGGPTARTRDSAADMAPQDADIVIDIARQKDGSIVVFPAAAS